MLQTFHLPTRLNFPQTLHGAQMGGCCPHQDWIDPTTEYPHEHFDSLTQIVYRRLHAYPRNQWVTAFQLWRSLGDTRLSDVRFSLHVLYLQQKVRCNSVANVYSTGCAYQLVRLPSISTIEESLDP
jgi:hypothetical protein